MVAIVKHLKSRSSIETLHFSVQYQTTTILSDPRWTETNALWPFCRMKGFVSPLTITSNAIKVLFHRDRDTCLNKYFIANECFSVKKDPSVLWVFSSLISTDEIPVETLKAISQNLRHYLPGWMKIRWINPFNIYRALRYIHRALQEATTQIWNIHNTTGTNTLSVCLNTLCKANWIYNVSFHQRTACSFIYSYIHSRPGPSIIWFILLHLTQGRNLYSLTKWLFSFNVVFSNSKYENNSVNQLRESTSPSLLCKHSILYAQLLCLFCHY